VGPEKNAVAERGDIRPLFNTCGTVPHGIANFSDAALRFIMQQDLCQSKGKTESAVFCLKTRQLPSLGSEVAGPEVGEIPQLWVKFPNTAEKSPMVFLAPLPHAWHKED
jgi:hypothetical protein